MIKKISILFLFSLLLSCLTNTNKIETKYYRSIAVNMFPFWEINGVYELSNDEVLAEDFYYKFELDNQLRPIKIEFYKNGKMFNGVSQHYGNLGAPILKIRYSEKKEIREYFDVFGNNIKGRWGAHKDIYSLDEKGRKIRLQFFSNNDRPIDAFNGINTYNWSWINDSTLTERRFNTDGKFVKSDSEWSFDIIKYKLNKKRQYVEIINYDFINQSTIDNLNGVAKIKFNYNEFHQEIGAIFFNQNQERVLIGGESGNIGIGKSLSTFDSKGRMIKEQYFDLENRLTPFKPYGFSQREVTYLKYDNRYLKVYLDSYGNIIDPFGKGNYYDQEMFDEDGYTIERNFLGKDKKNVNEKRTYAYDANRRLIEILIFKLKGNFRDDSLILRKKTNYIYDKINLSSIPIDTLITDN